MSAIVVRGQLKSGTAILWRASHGAVGMRSHDEPDISSGSSCNKSITTPSFATASSQEKPILSVVKISGPARLPVPTGWGQHLTDYLSALAAAGKPATTRTTRRGHLSRIARALDGRPQDVTGQQLVDWFGTQTQWSTETRRGYRNTARSFFGWAQETGRISGNPALALDPVKPSKPAPRPVPDPTLQAAKDRAAPRTVVMLRLGAEVGLRRAEIAQVHTNDVSYSAGRPQLLVHGKGDKERLLPISDEIAELILAGAPGHTSERAAFGREGFLFPGDDKGHLSPRWVGKLCSQALPGVWTLHKCRHRFAATVFRGSRNLKALQVLLGHESLATTEIYTPVDDDEIRAAMMTAAA